MNKQHSAYLSEDAVVRGQSKVEKAKYVHTENNLRRTLENINESFKRTNKRLDDETETLRSDLHKLKLSVVKVRQEKMKRLTGEYVKNRRPYQAERLLCDENIVTLRPFDSSSKFVTQRKSWTKKQRQRQLVPIKLHQNKLKDINDKDELFKHDEKKQGKALPEVSGKSEKIKRAAKLPRIETSFYKHDKQVTAGKEIAEGQISNDSTELEKHVSIEENNATIGHLQVPRIPLCELIDIHAYGPKCRANIMQNRPHFLPPLPKIMEDKVEEINSSFPVDNISLMRRDEQSQ